MFSDYTEFSLAKQICRACPVGSVYNRVIPSAGTWRPVVMVIGEAPGADEVEQGAPFVGKSGRLLRDTMNEFGFRQENTLISNTMPCRPENNTFPKDNQMVGFCVQKWLMEEVRLVSPKFILLIGSTPLRYILSLEGITKARGHWYQLKGWTSGTEPVMCMPTFHPSYVQRKAHMDEGPEITRLFRLDIRTVALKAGFTEE